MPFSAFQPAGGEETSPGVWFWSRHRSVEAYWGALWSLSRIHWEAKATGKGYYWFDLQFYSTFLRGVPGCYLVPWCPSKLLTVKRKLDRNIFVISAFKIDHVVASEQNPAFQSHSSSFLIVFSWFACCLPHTSWSLHLTFDAASLETILSCPCSQGSFARFNLAPWNFLL